MEALRYHLRFSFLHKVSSTSLMIERVVGDRYVVFLSLCDISYNYYFTKQIGAWGEPKNRKEGTFFLLACFLPLLFFLAQLTFLFLSRHQSLSI